jgi:2-polyprenyl-3-methyl-5-hydroxy-6-metoxy-1,4-benzoquinol methylase
MSIDIREVEEDFDTRYVDYFGARSSFSGAAHVSRYLWVKKFVKNKKVLDAGCGSGYGANILSKDARSIMGIDISKNAIEYSKIKYDRTNTIFMVKDMSEEGDIKERFDVIISFDVLEHIKEPHKYLQELTKLLNEDGMLIVGTPNLEVNELYNASWNPFHAKEYTSGEFKLLLSQYFNEINVLGQYVVNDRKKEAYLINVKAERGLAGVKKDYIKSMNAVKNLAKAVFPFWLKYAYKYIKVLWQTLIKSDKLFFLEDIGFSSKNVNGAFGLIAICKSKK